MRLTSVYSFTGMMFYKEACEAFDLAPEVFRRGLAPAGGLDHVRAHGSEYGREYIQEEDGQRYFVWDGARDPLSC